MGDTERLLKISADNQSIDGSSQLSSGSVYSFISSKGKVPENGKVDTFFLLLNAMIGSGILAQAYCFKESGIGLTLFLYALIAYWTFIAIKVTIKAAAAVSIFDYVDLSERLLGYTGKVVAVLSITLSSLGSEISYIITISKLSASIASSLEVGCRLLSIIYQQIKQTKLLSECRSMAFLLTQNFSVPPKWPFLSLRFALSGTSAISRSSPKSPYMQSPPRWSLSVYSDHFRDSSSLRKEAQRKEKRQR